MTDRSNDNPQHDELDALLRQWHDANAEQAAAGRDRLMARLRARRRQADAPAGPALGEALAIFFTLLRRAVMNRYSPAVASLMFLVVIVALLLPGPQGGVYAGTIMVPEGGRLDALDDDGNVLGPCPLKHTDVDVRVSGFFSRVDVEQTYHNPYDTKIEAVYTFPLSHRGAVDRMTMTIGDRVVVGEVKQREAARRIYEAARSAGYAASLLEQQRPNIFTQSVANIEPGAEVIVRISYVEVLKSADGRYAFDFPMVVGPRYVPGAPLTSASSVPAELKPRRGVVLLGPAKLELGAAGDLSGGSLQPGRLAALLHAAQPIEYPGDAWRGAGDATGGAGQAVLWYRFTAEYTDGSREFGELFTDGTGSINGRWFYTDPSAVRGTGTGFAQDTNRVPDASRVTPMPAKPGTRAGHDISLRVTIDSGGPGLLDIASAQHEVKRVAGATRPDGLPTSVTVALAEEAEIPNRDFVLTWRQTADVIQEATFVHTAENLGEWSGGFFTLLLQPPDRVADAEVPARELVFVMDTSGSMRGLPMEKSKAVMTRAIAAMRPDDTFNVVTFAGGTRILWDSPRPATAGNRAEAAEFVATRRGSGGTEMMTAIEAALLQPAADGAATVSPRALADLPADGRRVELAVPYARIGAPTTEPGVYTIPLGDDLAVRMRLDGDLPPVLQPIGVTVRAGGRWSTVEGRRVLLADRVWLEGAAAAPPMRLAVFLTDGYVANDMAIVDAVRRNAHTTRVFTFGIGNSVNRYLLEEMARAGRGEAEFVLLDSDADEAVRRFAKRIGTPVLADVELDFDGLDVVDVLPAPGAIPDLFDVKPLVVHGRYRSPGAGTVTVRGRTGAGPWSRRIPLELPETAPAHDVIATLWARTRIDEIMTPHLAAVQDGNPPADVRDAIIELGETFEVLSQYTSFVAVEKSRLTVGGEPVLVAVPIEMPDGVSYEGVFGADDGQPRQAEAIFLNRAITSQSGVTAERLHALGSTGDDRVAAGFGAPPSEVVRSNGPKRGAGTGGGARPADNRALEKSPPPGPGASAGRRAPAAEPEIEQRPTVFPGKERRSAGDAELPADAPATARQRSTEDLDEALLEAAASAQPAEQVIDESARQQRNVRLSAVLHEALLPVIAAPGGAAGSADLPRLDGRLLVTVLVTRTDEKTTKALADAGLRIEAVSESLPIVVGTADAAALEKLALLEFVKRIEPTRMEKAGQQPVSGRGNR